MTSSTLATRCPACSTTFKVEEDQLRISDGWVRCGRCSEIFDGHAHLQDDGPERGAESVENSTATNAVPPLESLDAMLDASPAKTAFDFPDFSRFPSGPEAGEHSDAARPANQSDEPDEDHPPEKASFEVPAASTELAPAPWLGHWPSLDLQAAAPGAVSATVPTENAQSAPASVVVPAVLTETPPEAPFDVARAAALAEPAAGQSSAAEPESAKPGDQKDQGEHSGFATLDQPEGRVMRWLRRLPGLDRLPLRTISAGALVVLGVQTVYQSRDALAASRPSLAPALSAMCKTAGCAVSALRRIDAISIDSASFARDPSGEGYQLTFTLRNRSALPLAMPAVELTLLDTQEQAVVRRVLMPSEFNAPDVLPANAERSTLLPLALSDASTLAPVAGYGIAAFYP